ncbi:hypothetical protein [Criibacterium bergeronii]|nr:hypothetical protein [Criibacterium bergeronii]MBS6062907.1 hypothetical protein [Peptostreptococcaceae bacterium]
MHRTLTNKYLASQEYDDISKRYKVKALKLLNRRIPDGMYGGVRGRLLK